MAKKKVAVKKKPFKPQPGSLRWTAIREDYIAQNLLRRAEDKPAFNFRMAAEAHGVSYDHLRTVAAAEKWNAELELAIASRADKAVAKLDGVAVWDEIEIRTRQATYARLASSVAYQRLQKIRPDDIATIPLKLAIELLKVGLSEERQALGLRDVVGTPPAADERMLTDTQVFAVARRVLQLKKDGGNGSSGTDFGD